MERFLSNPLAAKKPAAKNARRKQEAKSTDRVEKPASDKKQKRVAKKTAPAKVDRALKHQARQEVLDSLLPTEQGGKANARLDRASNDDEDAIIGQAKRPRLTTTTTSSSTTTTTIATNNASSPSDSTTTTTKTTPCKSTQAKSAERKRGQLEKSRRVKPLTREAEEKAKSLLSVKLTSTTAGEPQQDAVLGKRKAETLVAESPKKKAKHAEAAPRRTAKGKPSARGAGATSRTKAPVDEKTEQAPAAQSAKKVSESNSRPRGLVNTGNCCFANAATQFLLAAWTPADITSIRGTEELDGVALDGASLRRFDASLLRRATVAKIPGYDELKKQAQELAPAVPRMSSYYGQVLQSLLAPADDDAKVGYTTQIFFQHLYAEGRSEEWNGLGDQQDSRDFVDSVVEMLDKDQAVGKSRFETLVEVHRECGSCQNRVEVGTEASYNLHVLVQKTKTVLKELIDTTLGPQRLDGATCEKCKKLGDILEYRTVRALPDTLIVTANRDVSIFNTPLSVPYGEVVPIQDKHYQVSAVIKHQGRDHYSGHYWAIRREGDKHYILNDKDVDAVGSVAKLADSNRTGRTYLVLLSAVPKPDETAA